MVELFAVITYTLTTFKTKPCENHTLSGRTSLLRSYNGVTPPLPAFTSCLLGHTEPGHIPMEVTSKLLYEIAVMRPVSRQLNYYFATVRVGGFWMQCNVMFVIISHSDLFWLVRHSSPINRVGGHVQNAVCFKPTARTCICRKMFFITGSMKIRRNW